MVKKYFIHATLNEGNVSPAGLSVGRFEMRFGRSLKEKIKEKELDSFLNAMNRGFITIHEICDIANEEDITAKFVRLEDELPTEKDENNLKDAIIAIRNALNEKSQTVEEPKSAEITEYIPEEPTEKPRAEVASEPEFEEEPLEVVLARIIDAAKENVNEDGRIPCPYCAKTYANSSSSMTALKDHIAKHHSDIIK